MSTGHFEDIDHDPSDGFAEAMRETAFSFDAPASTALHAGALAHARRHRRRSVAAGTVAVVAAVGVAGAIVTQIPSNAGSAQVSAGNAAATGGPTTKNSSPGRPTTTPATASPARPATSAERKALGKSVLDTALTALPAGFNPVRPAYGIEGSKFPSEKHLPVTPPTDILGSAYAGWDINASGTVSVSVDVEFRTKPLTCARLTLSASDSCTTASFSKGGQFIVHGSRKDPINQTGSYFWDYVWLRRDGSDIEVSQIAPAVSQFAWTTDQVKALFELPVWDQTFTQLQAYIAAAGN